MNVVVSGVSKTQRIRWPVREMYQKNSTFLHNSSIVNNDESNSVDTEGFVNKTRVSDAQEQQSSVINLTPVRAVQDMVVSRENNDVSTYTDVNFCSCIGDTSCYSDDYSSEIEAWAMEVNEHFSSYGHIVN